MELRNVRTDLIHMCVYCTSIKKEQYFHVQLYIFIFYYLCMELMYARYQICMPWHDKHIYLFVSILTAT